MLIRRHCAVRRPIIAAGNPGDASQWGGADRGARGTAATDNPAPVLVEGAQVDSRVGIPHRDPAGILGRARLPPRGRRVARRALLAPGIAQTLTKGHGDCVALLPFLAAPRLLI